MYRSFIVLKTTKEISRFLTSYVVCCVKIDFNGLAMAQAVYEDMYLILYRTDGVQYAEELRKKITQQTPAKLAKAQGTPTRHEVNNSRFF